MARRRRAGERREPVFDIGPSPAPRSGPPRRESGDAEPRRRRGGIRRFFRRRRSRRSGRSRIGRIVYWSLVGSLWTAIVGAGAVGLVIASLPPIHSLEIPKRPPSIAILDVRGRPLATRGDMGGAAVPLGELPRHVPQAFIAIEDRRFYSHFGIDPIGVTRALYANVMRGGVAQGGSTITQQLAKNLFLTPDRTLTRKVQEVALALWLEHRFSKQQILELYLNRVYFGAGAYGIEAAAQRYFDKPARALNVPEAAMLAGLVRSPSRLAPSRNPDGAERRAQIVLSAMAEMKFVTDGTAKTAMMQPARAVRPAGAGSTGYVADWVMDVIDALIGRVEEDLVVETTIDPAIQAAAETALVEHLERRGEKAGVRQGAVVAMTPGGSLRAIVGGRNYSESQFNRATAARRQPGSAFKPFVYLAALERGMTPDTVREDKPVSIRGWRPENYTREYFGPVTLKQALAMSLNTVSVRLTMEVTPAAVIRTAHRLGIASKLEPNASIALGTSEVSVLELVAAYAPLANGGHSVQPHVVERVRTANGKLLYVRARQNLGSIVEPRTVAMMNDMMQETLITGTARKADVPGWPAAGKTGTSQDFRDAWFVGYTGHLVAGVWLGNDDGKPTRRTTGGGLPAEIWSKFMRQVHQGVPVAALPGASRGPQNASLLPPIGAPFGPPPAPIPNRQAEERPAPAGGIDNWLIDRLFGRR